MPIMDVFYDFDVVVRDVNGKAVIVELELDALNLVSFEGETVFFDGNAVFS